MRDFCILPSWDRRLAARVNPFDNEEITALHRERLMSIEAWPKGHGSPGAQFALARQDCVWLRAEVAFLTLRVRYDSGMYPKAYRILFADSIAALEEKVTAALAEDWHLIGGIAVSVAVPDAANVAAVRYLQAVART